MRQDIDWTFAPPYTTHYHHVQMLWVKSERDYDFYWDGVAQKWEIATAFDNREMQTIPEEFRKITIGGEVPTIGDMIIEMRNNPNDNALYQGIKLTSSDVPGYEKLRDVFERAYDQAARGKGKERHAKDLPFHLQSMQQIGDLYGIGFMLGQCAKKIEEAQRLPREQSIKEMLGAIVYISGAIIFIEKQPE